MSDIHPYFVATAWVVFHEAQGDPDVSTALAEWPRKPVGSMTVIAG